VRIGANAISPHEDPFQGPTQALEKGDGVSTSDTPRTDKAENAGCWANDSDLYVEANFARQLERELTAAQARVAELDSKLVGMERAHEGAMSTVRGLERQNEELEKDKARLDWLEANAHTITCMENVAGNITDYFIDPLRAAIDAAMTPPPEVAPQPTTSP